jgi:hypothetical protein
MDQIQAFFNDPLIAGIWALLVISLLDMLLGVYRSIQQGVFDWAKLPGILDATVLQKVIPLAVLGIAAFFVTEPTAQGALKAAYLAGVAASLAAAVAAIIKKVTGSYLPTTQAMDRGITAVPPKK